MTSANLNVFTVLIVVVIDFLYLYSFKAAFICAFITFLQLPGDKISGLAKFFLGIGVPGNAKDLYYQIDALACLESNRRVIKYLYQ